MFSIDEVPRLRRNSRDDGKDGKRVSYVEELWQMQEWALQQRDRQIEENIRMLAGQQWMVYSDLLQKWVDISEYLSDAERRWRQRPVINRLLFWYMLTKARTTENPPVVTFQPATGDETDAMLAEVMDPIFKSQWSEMGMLEKVDDWMSWVIAAGTGYLKTRVDLSKGQMREWFGPTTLTYDPPDGEPMDVVVPIAPFDKEGNPQVELIPEDPEAGKFGFKVTGEPFREREGGLNVDVLSPLEVRGQWGPTPWHEKRWHLQKSLLTPEEVWDLYGVECKPDTRAGGSTGNDSLQRLLFGSGYYGAAANHPGSAGGHGDARGLVTVYELWHRPTDAIPGMEETPDSPGGRLLICTPDKVIRDGPRPVRLPYTSPIRKLDFVNLPGRPSGTTPQEMLNPIQRTYNRGVAQILEHRNLVSNPVVTIDKQSNLTKEDYTNKPGLVLEVTKRPGVNPIDYAQPPQLSEDVYRVQGMLQDEMAFLGNLEGTSGEAPTRDASGELVKELRFNTDRFTGPVMRRAVVVLSRMVEDWITYLPTIWDREKVISYAGEDNIARTMTVWPDLFESGHVNVRPDVESMLPEGRGERQTRIYRMWQDGAFGDPVSPQARRQFLELMRFPHMDKAVKPGGVHRRTAKRENGQMLRGEPAEDIPVLGWYDHEVHLEVHYEFMSSPEYLKQPEHVQFAFKQHAALHEKELQMQLMEQLQMEQMMAAGPPEEGATAGGGGAGGGGETGPGGGDKEGVPSIVPRGPDRGGLAGIATGPPERPEGVAPTNGMR